MRVRPGQSGDLDAVGAVARECFGASAWPRHRFATIVSDATGTLWVADLPHQACVGYAVTQWMGGGEAELQSLAVLLEFRRAGIGAALLKAALAGLRRQGATTVFLEVREGNATAQAFYRRAGFERCGRRERYYREPEEAAVVMRCQLSAVSNQPGGA